MSASAATAAAAPAYRDHPLDHVSLGKIVQIRERLLAAAAEGKRVYRFESGDPSFTPAPHVIEAVVLAAHAGRTHYVPNNGIPELRRVLAHKVVEHNGFAGVTPDDVFLTNGAMHALFAVFGVLLQPGDEVIIPDPMWTEVAENIRLAGGVPVGVPLDPEHGYEYRAEDVEAAVTDRTVALFINTPHNPTGAVLGRDALLALLDVARRRGLWVVSDEAYEDVIFEPHRHYSVAALAGDDAERVVSIFSFSKSHAMAGLRTGYVITRSALMHERLPKLLRCTINGVNALSQWAAVAAVNGGDAHIRAMREAYGRRRDLLLASLEGIPGVRVFPPAGTFFLWAELEPSVYQRLGVADAAALSEKLASEGIGSAPGDAFGHARPDALRFAFSCETSMVIEGGRALREALS